MNTDQMTPVVRRWLRHTEATSPDARQSARQVMARMPYVRQRGRWWRFPLFHRRSQQPTATDTTEHQPRPIPATNGHAPTVIGRTQTMFSPIKAITAGALVFALGGAFLIVQPFGQQDGLTPPAAESVEASEPVEFTLVFGPSTHQGTAATCDVVDGVNHCRDARPPAAIIEASDPRLDGQLTVSLNEIQYPDHPWLLTVSYRIFNSGGVWQGSGTTAGGPMTIVLAGEGGYEGLYAVMSASDGDVASGVIYPTAPLEATDLDPLAAS